MDDDTADELSPKETCGSNSEINDIRPAAAFKGVSFSNYKKTDVKNQLLENIQKGRIEPSCYWCAELICAGHFMDVWEIILHYTGKYIHLGNPKIVIYLEKRFEMFRSVVSQGHFINEYDLRNHKTIRKLFAEIISTVVLSNKKHSFEAMKINRNEEFDMTQMTDRLIADHTNYAVPIMRKDDPKELFIAMNEFAYHISNEKRKTAMASYWIEWVIEFDAICKIKKQPCFCERRSNIPVQAKYQRDIVWLLWDVILHYCEVKNDEFIEKLMNSLLHIFCIKYTTASCKKRRYLLYFAVLLLTETVPTNIELMPNKPMIQTVVMKIDEIYKQIKKNEQSPNTDYLFAGLERQNNFEKSLRKMELMNSIDFGGAGTADN
jgi:hypothetical protein